jgi:hypothetical protein
MKLYETFQDGGYHTTLMTSFCVEFDAFESIVLNRLRSAGCRNIMLVCDADMLALTLSGGSNNPKHAGSGYLVARASSKGVFHPKVIVQIGRKRGRLIVASANTTASGLAGNLEIAAAVECGSEDSGARRLVLAGWRYALSFLDGRQTATSDKVRWTRDRCPWLEGDAAGDEMVDLADGTKAAFVTSGGTTGIAAKFAGLVEAGRPIDRLAIVSPYWDDELAGLDALRSMLQPKKTVLLIDADRKAFPVDALPSGNSEIQLSDLKNFDPKLLPEKNARFIHAKVIVATVGKTDHVLAGSANCTFAALGNANARGINEEACLYRRLPAGKVFDDLGLTSLLEKDRALAISTVPKPVKEDELPLEEVAENDSGVFEVMYDTLHWWPPAGKTIVRAFDQGTARLELLDSRGEVQSTEIDPLAPSDDERRFRLGASAEHPSFARFRRQDGTHTCLAIVSHVNEMRAQTRDPLTTQAERAVRELQYDDDEGLWLLDVIQTLAAPPTKDTSVILQPPKRKRVNDAPAGSGPTMLSYEAFMKGRRREIKKSEAERNALADSSTSFVRAALNRLLLLDSAPPADLTEDTEEQETIIALGRGDETADASTGIEEGFEPEKPNTPTPGPAAERKKRLSDVKSIVSAVDAFTTSLRAGQEDLTEVDMLRLRAMLMIVTVAGWPGPEASPLYKPSLIQVLPCHDQAQTETWPRLIGRILAAMYQGPNAAIRRLKLDLSQERIPDDLLEAMACSYWTAKAAVAAAASNPGCRKLVPHLASLPGVIASIHGLSPEELAAPAYGDVIIGLDRRFAERLRIPPLAVHTATGRIVETA